MRDDSASVFVNASVRSTFSRLDEALGAFKPPAPRELLDAAMRQAQQWIEQNVPKADRLIVDDALWLDLVRGGRDRRNVVWAYKVDTDKQVQGWAPHGWSDYELGRHERHLAARLVGRHVRQMTA